MSHSHRGTVSALALAAATLTACADSTPTAPLDPAQLASQASLADPIVVTNTNDSGAGSLRQAIADAQSGDVITFHPGIAGQTIALETELYVEFDNSITIEGPVNGGMTISGGGVTRVLFSEGDLTLRNLTITGGNAPDFGGGIVNLAGDLRIENTTVHGNTTSAIGFCGGIFSSNGDLTIANSTITGNSAPVTGGVCVLSGSVTILHSTIVFNSGQGSVGALQVSNAETISLANTIIAHNTGGPDAPNCTLTFTSSLSVAHILSNTGECSSVAFVADPLLGPLADNGGPTMTHALLPGSPAMNSGADLGVEFDQRYVARPQGRAPDIGAYEFADYPTLELTINDRNTVDPNTGVAVISGTLSCPEAATTRIEVHLAQEQRQRRVVSTVHGSAALVVECEGLLFWSASVAAASGAFQNGNASATATAAVPSGDPFLEPASHTQDMRLFWGKK